MPGCEPEVRPISVRESAVRELIGCTFETRAVWTDNGWGDAVIICADQMTARALNYPDHIWFPTGTIAGPVIVINKPVVEMNGRLQGQYRDLSDEDIEQWRVKLAEFETELGNAYAHRSVTTAEEKEQRRRHRRELSLEQMDDLSAVLGFQVEIEQRVRERILAKLPYPDRLSRKIRLELPQALAIAAALDAIPHQLVRLIHGLGDLRNNFAHVPGYIATPGDVERLKVMAENVGLEDTRWAFDQMVDETVGMSEESRDLRMIYNRVLVELDDDVIEMKSE